MTRKRPLESEFGEMMAFFVPFMQLSVAGIQSKMEPKEVVNYFIETVKEFTKRIQEIDAAISE